MGTPERRKLGLVLLVAYVGTIVAANAVVARFGVVPVGFGLRGPAAVYVVGLAFTLRDLTQDLLGRAAVLLAIGAGAVLSLLVAPQFAVASAVAFGVSELADFAVYTPLRERGWLRAVAVSNAVGLVVDSVIFLRLAFGNLDLPGQIVGKAWMTVLAVGVLALVRRRTAWR